MKVFQRSILKSALHSARIEGNPLNLEEAEQVVKKIIEDSLPPRRYEILQIIRDHQQVSFNLLKRRFLAVSDRLLRYDLKKLQDVGLIKKRGVTKGAIYEPLASNPD